MTSPRGSLRRSERSRRAILDATRALVAEHGYAKVGIEAIAARAGVGKQTIYRWWPSKGAVVLDAVRALSENGEGQLALPDTGDLEGDLKQVLRATAAEFADPTFDALIRGLTTELAHDLGLAAAYAEHTAELEEAKRQRLRSGQRAGQLSPDADLDIVLDLLFAPLFRRWLLRTGPLTPDYADTLVEAALRAFAPPEPVTAS
ncbi:TetR/AcrR family transcriptional regulator [Saccharomonospora xinjiangensis]|uniref:Transcriptional regulator n=1 Tax=Saccharomonospora xinjiangensis XJ-54 TaxID=882086 RepID=I0V8L0_9PSEU|nr:TetR/AcrR family transcriptional regulator [Saccharomonospora xinjiangensis]EID56463.1 transcriptional regulator [Saccharomonospora xinjiangensis XJ-54]